MENWAFDLEARCAGAVACFMPAIRVRRSKIAMQQRAIAMASSEMVKRDESAITESRHRTWELYYFVLS